MCLLKSKKPNFKWFEDFALCCMDKFYRKPSFYSLEDLRLQGLAWNKRYNNLPKAVLGFKTPNEVELQKLIELMEDTGEIRCPKRLTSIES